MSCAVREDAAVGPFSVGGKHLRQRQSALDRALGAPGSAPPAARWVYASSGSTAVELGADGWLAGGCAATQTLLGLPARVLVQRRLGDGEAAAAELALERRHRRPIMTSAARERDRSLWLGFTPEGGALAPPRRATLRTDRRRDCSRIASPSRSWGAEDIDVLRASTRRDSPRNRRPRVLSGDAESSAARLAGNAYPIVCSPEQSKVVLVCGGRGPHAAGPIS